MMAVLVFCSDLFVWRVEVTGAEGVLAEDVRAVVAAGPGGPGHGRRAGPRFAPGGQFFES